MTHARPCGGGTPEVLEGTSRRWTCRSSDRQRWSAATPASEVLVTDW